MIPADLSGVVVIVAEFAGFLMIVAAANREGRK